MKKIYLYLIAAGSGIMTGLAVSYFLPAALQWVTMAPLLVLLFLSLRHVDEKKVRHGLYLGFSYFYPYYLTVWYWFLTMYPLDFTEMTPAAALAAVMFAWLGLPLLQAAFAMWQVPLFLCAARNRAVANGAGARLTMPLLYALIYIIFEWAQTLTWAGVPWGRLAIGQAYVPVFVQTASLFGSYFVSLVIVLVNGYIALAVLTRKEVRRAALSLSMAVLIFAMNLVSGVVINITRTPDDEGGKVAVGIIQGNVSSSDKWSDDSFDNLSSVYGRLTSSAAEDGAELVLWTETAIPYIINKYPFMRRFVEVTADVNDITLLATAFWRRSGESEAEEDYNAVMSVTPDGEIDTENIYAKRKLVPFGEFVPFEAIIEKLVPPLASMSMFENALSVGEDAVLLETEYGHVGALVCFDSIYEECALDAVRAGAELLTVSTNDSWFGESAALYQHTAQGILRAVETDRYVARAGNTGYSCVIAPSGKITSALPINVEDYLVADVFTRNTVTLYSIVGNVIIVIAAVFVALVTADSVIYNIMKRKKRKASKFYVRAVREEELDTAVRVYDDGRRAIAALGIDQWQDGYPPREQTAADIADGILYAAVDPDGEHIAAVAAMVASPDHDYDVIDGAWLSNGEYVAVHRVAASDVYRGGGAVSLLFEQIEAIARGKGIVSLRVDTHRGNVVMQRFLCKHGFEVCGEITLSHGDGDRVRRAYEKLI